MGNRITATAVLVLFLLGGSSVVVADEPNGDEDILSNRFLGSGYFSGVNALRRPVVGRENTAIRPGDLTGESSEVRFGLIANREEFDRSLSIDVEASGYGQSATASLRQRISTDLKQVTFAVTIKVVRGTVRLQELEPVTLALQARNAPDDYLRVFGTDIIDSVTLGGSCILYFTYTFKSAAEAKEFAASIGLSYGGASGSAKTAMQQSLKQTSNNINVTAIVAGTTDLPEFFGEALEKNADGTRGIFTSAFSDSVLNNILAYIDSFPGKIRDARLNALSTVGVTAIPPTDTELSIGDVNHQALEQYLDRARSIANSLNDQELVILRELRRLEEMREVYGLYNTLGNLQESARISARLDALFEQIGQRRTALRDDGDVETPFMLTERLPEVPRPFCTSQPTQVSYRELTKAQLYSQFQENVLTPVDRNVTYAVIAEAVHDHSRSEPGCNVGVLEVRRRAVDAPAIEDAREQGPWNPRPDIGLREHESVVRERIQFAACRGEGAKSFSTSVFPFSAEDARDVSVLYSNWDDPGYNTSTVRLYQCSQN